MPHLLLQLEDAEHERLGGRRAARNVDIDWYDSVTSSGDTVAVVVVTTTIGAAAHGNDPSWVGHLVVDLSQGGSHLVGEGSGDNHDIGLTGRCTENDSHSVLIVAGCGEMHHLDGAACKTESHGPQRTLTCPVRNLIKRSPACSVSDRLTRVPPLNRPVLFHLTYSAYCMAPCLPSWLGSGTSL